MIRKEIPTDKEINLLPFGSTIYTVELIDDISLNKNKKEINCKMKFIVRKGKSEDVKYNWYPNWSIEFTGENENITTWTPTRDLTFSFIEEIFRHELSVDVTRHREEELKVYEKLLLNMILNIKKYVSKYGIPEVYKKQNGI